MRVITGRQFETDPRKVIAETEAREDIPTFINNTLLGVLFNEEENLFNFEKDPKEWKGGRVHYVAKFNYVCGLRLTLQRRKWHADQERVGGE